MRKSPTNHSRRCGDMAQSPLQAITYLHTWCRWKGSAGLGCIHKTRRGRRNAGYISLRLLTFRVLDPSTLNTQCMLIHSPRSLPGSRRSIAYPSRYTRLSFRGRGCGRGIHGRPGGAEICPSAYTHYLDSRPRQISRAAKSCMPSARSLGRMFHEYLLT